MYYERGVLPNTDNSKEPKVIIKNESRERIKA